ncbi:MAG: ABC transporter permease subunit [Dehalococcoidia bacterium]
MAAETTTSNGFAILRDVLLDQRRSLPLWGLALAAISIIYSGFYPLMGDAGEFEELMSTMPEGLMTALGFDDIGTAAGYISSSVFGLLGPALLLVFAIGAGSRLIAGREEDGTLELELTHPVARRRILFERLFALWISIFALVLVVAIVVQGMIAALGMDVGTNEILAASTALLLLGLAFGTIALAAGAATGRRSVAMGLAAGLAVLSFIANAIGPVVDALGWLTEVSPWSWYIAERPLVNGWDLQGLLLLAIVPIVAAIVAAAMFNRRDLGV